jgi:hypothetical protein
MLVEDTDHWVRDEGSLLLAAIAVARVSDFHAGSSGSIPTENVNRAVKQ